MSAGVLIAITIIVAVFASGITLPSQETNSGITLPSQETKTGILTVLLTDAPVELESLVLTISKLEVHRVAGDEETDEGVWEQLIDEEDNPITFDLLQYQEGNTLLLVSKSITGGKYNKIRMYLSDDALAYYKEGNEKCPDNPHTLNVPSEKIDVITKFELEAGEAETILIDMEPDWAAISKSNNLRPTLKVIVSEPTG